MKFQPLKKAVCKFLAAALAFLLMMLVGALLEGSVSLPAGLLGLVAGLVLLNALCGALLPSSVQTPRPAPARRPVPRRAQRPGDLRVIHGGRAA